MTINFDSELRPGDWCLECGTKHPPDEPHDSKRQARLLFLNKRDQQIAEMEEREILGPSPEEIAQRIRAKYHVYTSEEIAEKLREAGSQRFLVANMLPMHSTALMLGDSGIGKSALLYQLGLSVASGQPFFNHPTDEGLVLFFDFENNIKEAHECVKTLAESLKLSEVPKNLITWNAHNAPKDWVGAKSMLAMIHELRPTLTIIDTLSKAFPDAEEKNSAANTLMGDLTDLVSKTGSSIIVSHHYKKNTGCYR
jgi:RecA-family ATPase